jgi:hypothetical protein
MSSPVVFITLGALAGAIAAFVQSGQGIGREIDDLAVIAAGSMHGLVETFRPTPPRPQTPQTPDADAGLAHMVFSTCLHSSGANVETTLRDLLEFHEHDATVALVGCLLSSEPARFCGPAGRQQAADAMEIYYWSRDDARRTSPAHGIADKIHMLDRAEETGLPPEVADPFAMTWSGPNDRAIFDRLRALVKQGYLDPSAFAFSGRAELRDALRDAKPEGSPCTAVDGAK